MVPFALTIFLSAFLLFQVQPIIARFILPWFGGSPAVWTTCMLFFQTVLLVGYCYSDVIARRLRPRIQYGLHIAVTLATLVFLPIIPSNSLKPIGNDRPVASILWLLVLTIGPVYCLLSTTGPLVQAWFARRFPGRSPYRLFALSNFGSLLALVSYPFLFEPSMSIRTQAITWSVVYLLFVVSCIWCAVSAFRNAKTGSAFGEKVDSVATESKSLPAIGIRQFLAWLAFSTMPSVLLLAVTNELSQEVAVVPMLWIVPLSLYLISFIICFERGTWYRRDVFGTILICSSFAAVYCLIAATKIEYLWQFAAYNVLLFSACMTCHGELARMKPVHERLTTYYLTMSIGGALGGVLVVVVAPMFFTGFYELPIAMLVAVGLTLGRWIQQRDGVSLTRTMLAFSIVSSSVLVVGYLLFRSEANHQLFIRLGLIISLWFITISLLGWQHLTKAFLPLPIKLVEPSRYDRLLWAATFALVFVYSWGLIVLPSWMADWGPVLGLLVVFWIWGVGIHTHFRPTVSLAVYGNLAVVFAFFLLQMLAVFANYRPNPDKGTVIDKRRNFFGICGVEQARSPLDGPFKEIFNGRIGHGRQYELPDIRNQPNLYYGPSSGIGIALEEHPKRKLGQPLNVAVVGLGTGTLASWGRPHDKFVFYEINPAVIELAERHFTYRGDSQATCETLLGDARVLMEQELSQGKSRQFDVLIVDAFSSDSIPRHLLTREAMDVYTRHLAEGGIVAIHISNLFLDLRPVVVALAVEFKMTPINVFDVIEKRIPGRQRFYDSNWMLISNNLEFLTLPRLVEAADPLILSRKVLWTDDFGSLLNVIKVKKRPDSWPLWLWPFAGN